MKTLGEIREIKQAQEADLLKRAGVTGVDIGYKYVGGKKTDVLAIRVYVAEKKDPKDVPKAEMIPKTIKGAKTDVIQRKFVLHPLRLRVADLEVKADTGTYDPLKGGISIGPCRAVWCEPPDVPSAGWYIFVGTLGAIVKDNDSGDPMLLSNFHVMCVDDGWSAGDTMAQPSRIDGGHCPADVVGALQRSVLDGGAAGGGPGVDCAVASHTARNYACEIEEIGEVTGTSTATQDMAVRKRGRTTGLTYGTVDTVDLSVIVPYGDGLGSVTLFHQIGIDVDPAQSAEFGISGDSGSVVVNDEGEVVGLYFAGNEEEVDENGNVVTPEGVYGVANPIQAVLDALNVSICVSKAKELKWEKFELKELKEEPEHRKLKEKFEPKEFKEKPEKWEWPEGKVYWEVTPVQPIQPIQPVQPVEPVWPEPRGNLEERLTRLEAAAAQVTRFRPQVGARSCIDFRTYQPASVPNPWTVQGVVFYALDHAGNPWLYPRIFNSGGFTGLDCGFRLEIELAEPCVSVEVTLVHACWPARIEAYNADGSFAGAASMSGPQGVAEMLTASGTSINRVVVVAPGDETLLLEFCCIREAEKGIGKVAKLEQKETKDVKFERWEGKGYWDVAPLQPIQPFQPGASGALEERLARLEAAIAQMTHFIKPEMRPDLSKGALRRESDLGQR
jgi:hypothetical protein